MDTEAALVELYGLAPEQFVAARDRLAKEIQDDGARVAEAAAIGRLRRPTIAAWLANQLVRVDPDGVHALTELGEQLREIYLSTDSARRRDLTRERHDLVAHLVRVARTKAARGRRVTAQTAERLAETLDAALVDRSAAQLLRTGQLTSALRHVGFGVVDENNNPASLPPTSRPRVVRGPQPARRPTAAKSQLRQRQRPAKRIEPSPVDRTIERRAVQRRLVEEAEADYAAAIAEHQRAEQVLDAHQHRIADLEADLIRLNEELERIRQSLREARKQLPRLQRSFRQAERSAAAVQKRRDTQQQRLRAMEG